VRGGGGGLWRHWSGVEVMVWSRRERKRVEDGLVTLLNMAPSYLVYYAPLTKLHEHFHHSQHPQSRKDGSIFQERNLNTRHNFAFPPHTLLVQSTGQERLRTAKMSKSKRGGIGERRNTRETKQRRGVS
jgi:hypothetical protein